MVSPQEANVHRQQAFTVRPQETTDSSEEEKYSSISRDSVIAFIAVNATEGGFDEKH